MIRLLWTTVFFVATFVAHSSIARAENCTCEVEEESTDVVSSATGTDGSIFKLRFPEAKVTTKSKLAYLCGESLGEITSLKLWMPHHGHGSSPVLIVKDTETCSRLEKLNFSMPGDWEVRLKLAEDHTATFELSVSRPQF